MFSPLWAQTCFQEIWAAATLNNPILPQIASSFSSRKFLSTKAVSPGRDKAGQAGPPRERPARKPDGGGESIGKLCSAVARRCSRSSLRVGGHTVFVSEAGARPSSPEARGLFTSWSRRVRKYNLGPEAVSEMGSETAYPSNCFSSSTSSHTIRTTMKRNKTRGRGRQCLPAGTCLVRGAVIGRCLGVQSLRQGTV